MLVLLRWHLDTRYRCGKLGTKTASTRIGMRTLWCRLPRTHWALFTDVCSLRIRCKLCPTSTFWSTRRRSLNCDPSEVTSGHRMYHAGPTVMSRSLQPITCLPRTLRLANRKMCSKSQIRAFTVFCVPSIAYEALQMALALNKKKSRTLTYIKRLQNVEAISQRRGFGWRPL